MAGSLASGDVRQKSVARFTAPIVLGALIILIIIFAILGLSGHEVDRISRERDRAMVSLVLQQSLSRVAHAQESTTIWDEAVLQVRRSPLDLKWVDNHMGSWFSSYAGLDEIYILDPHNNAIYAMRDGKRVDPQSYLDVEKMITPLVQSLRQTATVQMFSRGSIKLLSPGKGDIATIRGRPAIISVKPIISNTGKLPQTPGTEAVYVGVLFLNENVLSRIGKQYGLTNAHYTRFVSPADNIQSEALRDRFGKIVGYMTWKPFDPGSQVIGWTGPALLLVMFITVWVIYLLSSRLARRTQELDQSRLYAQHRAMHDDLTGLGNRTMFEQRLEEALSRSERHKSLQALLYIDLDRFKQVNDTLGHPSGDALIKQVAKRLLSEVRSYDLVARLGGDEFGVLIGEPADRDAVEMICSRIVSELERPFDLNGSQAYIGASIGVAMAPMDGVDATELTRKADIALYKAKNNGRSRYVFFTPDMDLDVKAREESYRDLRAALSDCERRLELHYQPIYAVGDGRMVGVEALLRWHHPEQGLIGPTDFIRSAEESGLIEVVGEWVLRRAIQDAKAWPGVRIAVNVSPIQLRSRKFVDTVRQILEEGSIEPARLELELTETALMGVSGDVARSLSELRWLGVACSLDDFGTGYSSLSHIRDFAVDRIKIDRSFVNAVDTVPGAALVEAIVSLARANGLNLTAEGVEGKEQYAFLRRVGCHEVQGYLLSRPVPADQIARLLQIPRPGSEDRPQMLL